MRPGPKSDLFRETYRDLAIRKALERSTDDNLDLDKYNEVVDECLDCVLSCGDGVQLTRFFAEGRDSTLDKTERLAYNDALESYFEAFFTLAGGQTSTTDKGQGE
jgi:hypothetical protein